MATKQERIKRTSIDLPESQYIFLMEKELSLKKQGKSATMVSIIRDLIDEDSKKWNKAKGLS